MVISVPAIIVRVSRAACICQANYVVHCQIRWVSGRHVGDAHGIESGGLFSRVHRPFAAASS
jgi:hypothetical protein